MPTLRSYITGFALSTLMTLGAFGAMWLHIYNRHRFPTHGELAALFVTLAILQLVVQLIYFLHIGKERGAHWRVIALSVALFVIIVVAGGSLWIMSNLEYMSMHASPFTNNRINVQNEQD